MSNNYAKDTRNLKNELIKQGWRDCSGNGHYKLRHPDYGVLVFSKTPSCPFWEKKTRANLKRLMENSDIIKQKQMENETMKWSDEDKLKVMELAEIEGITRSELIRKTALAVNRKEKAVGLQIDKMRKEGVIQLDIDKYQEIPTTRTVMPVTTSIIKHEKRESTEYLLRMALSAVNENFLNYQKENPDELIKLFIGDNGLLCVKQVKEIIW